MEHTNSTVDTQHFVEIAPLERRHMDYLADMYSVVVCIEKVETASHRELVTPDQYATTMRRLEEKYASVVAHFESDAELQRFLQQYCSEYRYATKKVEQWREAQARSKASEERRRATLPPKLVLEITQNFITLLDDLKLEQLAKDVVYPIFNDLCAAIKTSPHTATLFPTLDVWMSTLGQMQASDELTPNQAREFMFELECAYRRFSDFLSTH